MEKITSRDELDAALLAGLKGKATTFTPCHWRKLDKEVRSIIAKGKKSSE